MLEQAFARVLTGPTEEARARLTASLAAGKAGEEAARVARNVAQSTFLHLMFTVGRVLVKFSVATTDGISPVEITTALARAAERRSFAWLATAPPGLPPASPNTPNTTPARAGAPSAFPAPLQPLQRTPSSPGTYDKGSLKKMLEMRVAAAASAPPPLASAASGCAPASASATPRSSALCRTPHDAAGGPKALFRLSLFVAALGDGQLEPGVGGRTAERLRALAKVPKEQIIRVSLPKSKGRRSGALEETECHLRLFIAHSDDAKMMQRYIDRHKAERPAPFVLLAPLLPVALEYRPQQHDVPAPAGGAPLQLSAAAADRLRKQAKGRAVRLVRDVLGEAAVDAGTMRGHAGAARPAELLAAAFRRRLAPTEPVDAPPPSY